MKKVSIVFEDYDYDCADGCCTHFGTKTTLNGEELDCDNEDRETIVRKILEKLGFEVEIENI